MEARKVSAANGWLWIKQGAWLFKKSPILWMTLTIIAVSGLIGITTLPKVGDTLGTLLFPVLYAGLMLGCRSLEYDEELDLSHLFAGFKSNTLALLTLGGINLAAQLAILGVVSMAGGAALVDLLMSGQSVTESAILEQAVAEAGIAPLLGLLLLSVLLLGMQFAPMLIMFDKLSPFAALHVSFKGCLRNIIPLSIYGFVMMLFAIMATLPMLLGWLVLLPIMIASMYAAYRDLFPLPTEVAPPAASETVAPQ